ncbi:transcriptional regulator [Labedella gwakjiensis]|uniref:Transcriptional regulator n=1 Tax=Labedella gwakjiensis TaxID=390269 RepID=A0ABY0C5U0_9MICO|nr:transcriptional regulator [Labedella gwakjiensis]
MHSALAVLEEVAARGAGVTARELSDALRMPRATTYRLINLLVQEEYLVRMPDLTGFTLGRKVLQLAHLVAPSPPPRAAREVMTRLRSGIRGGVHLARYDTDRIAVVDVDEDFPLSDESRIVREWDASAMGRLLLAERDVSETPTRSTRSVAAIVEDTRRAGFARQVDELVPGFGCLAVPIRDEGGRLVASVCFAAPRSRIEQPGDVLEMLENGAEELGRLLV